MITLDYWLPEKEMFGTFSLDSLSQTGDGLCVTTSNEVFTFTITFAHGITACQSTLRSACQDRVDALLADFEVIMRGNTFFKLEGSDLLAQYGGDNGTHYVVLSPNYVVDIIATAAPSVTLQKAIHKD